MANGYSKQIQLRIHESPEGSIFVNSDFADIADTETIRRNLNRLTQGGILRRKHGQRLQAAVDSNAGHRRERDLHVLRRGAVLAARAYAGASAGSGSGVPGRYPEQWDLLHRRRWERKVLLRGYERHGRFPGTLGNNRNMKKSRSHTAAGS